MRSWVRGIIESSEDFLAFFEIVQQEASKLGKVFFIESEELHEENLNGMHLAEISGWLVPLDKADDFEKRWRAHDDTIWDNGTGGEFFAWEDFAVEPDGSITITFEDHGQDEVFDI